MPYYVTMGATTTTSESAYCPYVTTTNAATITYAEFKAQYKYLEYWRWKLVEEQPEKEEKGDGWDSY